MKLTLAAPPAARRRAAVTEPISIYLHVPFCSLKCSYCDFNSYAGLASLIPAFVTALVAELRLWARHACGRPVPTVYFGGGTPSLLPLPDVNTIMAAISKEFTLAEGAEISFEANPGTVDLTYLRGLREAGITRLSFGVQSFDDAELQALDRIHTAAEAIHGYQLARGAGFTSVSLDLIYGLTGQSMARWRANLEQAAGLGPDHLSCYALTVEDGTRLAHEIAAGRAPGPDLDLQADMYEWTQDFLASSGYAQYEISNWAKPGHECRHNLVYWRNGDWLGLGPGAHSHWDAHRFANVCSPRKYIASLGDLSERPSAGGRTEDVLRAMPQVADAERQAPPTVMSDTAILALRLNQGLSRSGFRDRFGISVDDAFGASISEMTDAGLLAQDDEHLRLTPNGRALANEVFMRLLPD